MWDFPLFPEQASVAARSVDHLYFALIAVSGFFSMLIVVLLTFFATRYYKGKTVNRTIVRTDYLKLELLWTIIPLIISGGIFIWGARLFFELRTPPKGAMEIYVIGKQWMWKVQHPRGNREINELHIPVGKTIQLTMTSQDVIHSFFIPAFRVKQDVLPGRFTSEWFEPTKVGEYHLFCAEYCGTMHSGMIGRIVVMEPQEYENWLAGSFGGTAMATSGEDLFQQFGCANCHTGGPGARGPLLTGLLGKQVRLSNGRTVVADLDYIRESILDSQAKIVEGYTPIMPLFKNQINQEQLIQLIEYIKGMSTAQAAVKGYP